MARGTRQRHEELVTASANPRLSALRIARRSEWHRRVRAAIVRERTIPRAAEALGISRRTLVDWVAEAPSLTVGVALPAPRGITARK